MSTAVAIRQTVVEIVAAYTKAVAKIREGYRLCAEAEDVLTILVGNSHRVSVSNYRTSFKAKDADLVIAETRQAVWRSLIERLELRRVLSVARSKELDAQVDKVSELPEVTVESVIDFVQSWEGQLEDRFQEAAQEVYSFLRPRQEKYKTNSAFRVGPKVILWKWVAETYPSSGKLTVNHYYYQEMTALENVFSTLDGQGLRSGRQYFSELQDAINKAPVGETKYFRYKCCKNGNLHLEFKRLDLVHQLNVQIGKTMLPKGQNEK